LHEYRLEKILSAFYDVVLKRFGRHAFSAVQKCGAVQLEHKFTETQFNEWIRNYIRTRTGRKVTNISKTTEKQIRLVILRGRQENLSYTEISKNVVDKTSGHIARSRAMTIARTEVHEASQSAQFEAIQETGLHVTKEWLAVSDTRTREDHADASGQHQNMEDPFLIEDSSTGGVDELMFPGDPDGPAHQVINCRCITLFNTQEKVNNDG
jgi:uncharacterized protein with gpF-like domain